MCWGNANTTGSNTTGLTSGTKSTIANPLTESVAAQQSSLLGNILNTSFQPYTGQQVAGFGPLQQQSFDMASNIAAKGVPYVPTAQSMIGNYANAGPQSVSPERIYQNMSPYMNQYVQQALAPQLELQNQQFNTQNRAADSAAVGAGAYGNDAQQALYKSNLTQQQDTARTGLIGNAYNAAFNTAIGAGAQDTATNLQGQTTNASLAEQALARQLGGAQALQGLGTYDVNTGINQANLLNQYGAQQTAQQQAQLNAAYNQYLMAQQYPFQQAQLGNQSLGAFAQALPGTQSTWGQTQGNQQNYATNNSGLNFLGSVGGAFLGGGGGGGSGGGGGGGFMGSMGTQAATALGGMMFSDERLKENIEPVGKLFDDSNVYAFNYKGDTTPRIGLMAQEVEQRTPEAVSEIGGYKAVDYGKATAPARGLARALGIAA